VSTLSSTELKKAVALLEKGDWQAAHVIVQQDEESSLPCWIHGVVHVLEGDLENARYWYGAAKRPFPEPYSLPDEIGSLKKACG
jgi:hypothetical protein